MHRRVTGRLPEGYRSIREGYWSVWEGYQSVREVYQSVREGYRSLRECYPSSLKSAEVEIPTYGRDRWITGGR